MSSNKAAVIVFGAAGAGKSTFINNLTGTEECAVSSRKNMDGTTAVTSVEYESFRFIDTVGADSKNAVFSTGNIRRKMEETHAAIVVVCRYDADRFTTWIHNRKDTRPVNAAETHEELDAAFGNAFSIHHFDDDSDNFDNQVFLNCRNEVMDAAVAATSPVPSSEWVGEKSH
ncbi:unnamed protein product [Sphagnum compactum]